MKTTRDKFLNGKVAGRLSRVAASFGLLSGLLLAAPAFADDGGNSRVLVVKPRIVSKTSTVRLKDVVVNTQSLSDIEKEYEVTEAPQGSDETISIVDLAYMLQKHPDLMESQLKGPKRIVIQRIVDSSVVDKAKAQIVSQIRSMAPWRDWEVDVVLSSADELFISRAAPFEKVEVLPSDNKAMIGPVTLNLAFMDADGRAAGKASINPTILKKSLVAVLNSNCKQGQILSETNIKRVPMWLGPENKDYVGELSECIGKELARNMSAGDIVKSGDVLSPICAKRGDIIWVECKSGALSVRLGVTALEGGRQGDIIKVINQPSQKTFSVQLVGEKQGVYKMGS